MWILQVHCCDIVNAYLNLLFALCKFVSSTGFLRHKRNTYQTNPYGVEPSVLDPIDVPQPTN